MNGGNDGKATIIRDRVVCKYWTENNRVSTAGLEAWIHFEKGQKLTVHLTAQRSFLKSQQHYWKPYIVYIMLPHFATGSCCDQVPALLAVSVK